MVAHNMAYDWPFLLRQLLNLQILEKANKWMSMKGDCCHWNSWTWETMVINERLRLVPNSDE